MKENILPEEDKVLFNKMKNEYVSEKEKKFFETLEKREQEHNANVDDILWNPNNKNSIWFYRFEYTWYMLHVPIKDKPFGEKIEFTCLSQLLDFDFSNVENADVDDEIHNVLDYLRKTEYNDVDYNRCEDA